MKFWFTGYFILWMSMLQAQVLLSAWEVNGQTGFGANPLAADFSVAGIFTDSLRRGTGIGTSGTAASNAWGGNHLTEGSDTAAERVGDWIEFSVKADSGYVLSLSQIGAYNIRRSSTGSDSGQWQYKVGSGLWTNIDNAINWGSITSAAGNSHNAVLLSSIPQLQGVPSDTVVRFRLLLWGASSSNGTWYINNQTGYDLQLFGDTQISSLPVHWLYARIRTAAQSSIIEWATVTEINNSHFDIEEANADGVFYPVGRVEGAGNSSIIQSYSFALNSSSENKWYRIRQTDFDGKFDFSEIISSQAIPQNDYEVKLWPNPSKNEVYVWGINPGQEIRIDIYDGKGKSKGTQHIDHTKNKLDLSMLEGGVYYLQIQEPGSTPCTRKIILKRD